MTNLSPEEQSVYDLIAGNSRITQLELARKTFVGCHDRFEGYDKPKQSTLRKVRQIVRDLRMNHNIPVLSDRNGYWIIKDNGEAEEYVKRMEKVAKAQSKSLFETFRVMKKMFNIESEYFEKEGNKIPVKAHTRTINKPKQQSGQEYLF